MVQTMKRSRKQRTDAAINYALERRWDLAVEENRALLEEYPDDIEAANRLGKALTELGDVEAAAEAYRRTLGMDPTNAIARRNLARLDDLKGRGAKKKPAGKKGATTVVAAPAAVRPQSLIEESGKSSEFTLEQPDAVALRRVSAGDPAELVATPRGVSVQSAAGAILGHIEPRAGLRLRRMMQGGNRYAVVIRHIEDGQATVYVRETYRHPSLLDQASFLPPAAARKRLAPRAYTKGSLVRYAGPVDLGEDGEEDMDSWGGPRAARPADDDDDFEDGGFGETSQDDEAENSLADDDDEPLADDDEDDL